MSSEEKELKHGIIEQFLEVDLPPSPKTLYEIPISMCFFIEVMLDEFSICRRGL